MVIQAMIRWSSSLSITLYLNKEKWSTTILVLGGSLERMALASGCSSWLWASTWVCSSNFGRCGVICVHKDSVLVWTHLLPIRVNLMSLNFGLVTSWGHFFMLFYDLVILDSLMNALWVFLNINLQLFSSKTDIVTCSSNFLGGNNSLDIGVDLVWVRVIFIVKLAL